jgi:hypothetical protein
MIQKKYSILITNCFYSQINRTAVISDCRFQIGEKTAYRSQDVGYD